MAMGIICAVPLALLARYGLFEDAGEFKRSYGALRAYVLPVLFVNLAVLAVILAAVVTKRVNFGSRERIINV
ncbi:hypothetical protein [Ensifer sp. 4252]|uniref:hypothetical protein n=1 Tax=Ensifer sp. 4252 TaxID=3373915 RepID=UPI003D20BCEF